MRIGDRSKTAGAAFAAVVLMAADSPDCHHHIVQPPATLPIRVVLAQASSSSPCAVSSVDPRSLQPFQSEAVQFTIQNTCGQAAAVRVVSATGASPFFACDAVPEIAVAAVFQVGAGASVVSRCTVRSLCLRLKIEVGSFPPPPAEDCGILYSGQIEVDPFP